MQKLIDKKITIIHRNGQSVSKPLAPKKGLTLFSLFSFSRVGSSAKSTATALKGPVLKNPPFNVPRVNLAAVRNWVALEEKIVHNYKEQKEAPPKSAIPSPKILPKQPLPLASKPDNQPQKPSSPLTVKKVFNLFDLFSSPKTGTFGKSATAVSKAPVLKSPALNVPRVNLTVVNSWVALEEKIVHNYKEQKAALPKSAIPSLKILPKQPLSVSPKPNNQAKTVFPPVTVKKAFNLFGLFASSKSRAPKKSSTDLPKESLSKDTGLDIPRVNLTAIKKWGALEEKIVRDYKKQKTNESQSVIPLPQVPAKQSTPALETFSTQTATAVSSPSVPRLKDPLRSLEKTFSRLRKSLLVLGWVAAGVFMFLYIQATFLNQKTSQRLDQLQSGFTQLQSEKEQLEQSYAALKRTSEEQIVEIKWLNNRLRDVTLELKTTKADYEAELELLRGTIQTQDAIVKALKVQNQVFEKIIDQAGMAALSGVAAGFSQGSSSAREASVSQGKVTSINEQQCFVVINVGSEQGARSGRYITISRSGIGLTVGKIDRVYPTMSVALLRNPSLLQTIQEGDSVSFS